MKDIITIFILAAIADNILFVRLQGGDLLYPIFRSKQQGIYFSLAFIFIGTASSCIAYLFSGVTQGRLFAVLIYAVVASTLLFAAYFISSLLKLKETKLYISLLAADTALLGVINASAAAADSLKNAFIYSLAYSAGFVAAFYIMVCISRKAEFSDPPRAFKGMPAFIAAAAIAAMALYGFNGFSLA